MGPVWSNERCHHHRYRTTHLYDGIWIHDSERPWQINPSVYSNRLGSSLRYDLLKSPWPYIRLTADSNGDDVLCSYSGWDGDGFNARNFGYLRITLSNN